MKFGSKYPSLLRRYVFLLYILFAKLLYEYLSLFSHNKLKDFVVESSAYLLYLSKYGLIFAMTLS